MNTTEYKLFHESFMQNNHGSTAIHTFLTIFFTVQCSLLCAIKKKTRWLPQFIFEYMLIVLPMIVAHTILFEYSLVLNVLVFIIFLLEIKKHYNHINIYQSFMSDNLFNHRRIHSITCLRALTYIITAFCILAVDFKDFPRYLAKTEKYGYSLMDTGVGLFVLMSGLVHKDASKTSYWAMLKGNAKIFIILFTLGTVRFITIKHLDYHEHVTEYGVHWNFFFTLALCKIISTVILLLPANTLFLSMCVLFIHEYWLYIELQDWVYSDSKRMNILDANREGISSCLGYVSLYLFAVHLNAVIIKNNVKKYLIVRKLFVYSFLLVLCTYIINMYRPISRTLANAGYCTYLSAILSITLSIMFPIEVIFRKKNLHFKVPQIFTVVNSNGLLYFLICNISTGLINIIFKTLLMSSWSTFVILNLYMIFNINLVWFR